MDSEFAEMAEKITAVVCILIVMMLVGCATPPLPYCEKPTAQLIEAGGETVVIFDAKNAVLLRDMITGMSEGKCRLDNRKGLQS